MVKSSSKTYLIATIVCWAFCCGFARYAVAKNFTIVQGEQRVVVDIVDHYPRHRRDTILRWLRHNVDALSVVYGELPLDYFKIEVHPANRANTSVPWGEVKRDNITTVLVLVNPHSSLRELKDDWTLYHELSHLLLPYDGWSSRWFTEGLASYYQNILQARVGSMTEKRLWRKLYDGFERGKKQNQLNHQPLALVSQQMRRNKAYMRIYWSGALYWLTLDVELRKRKGDIASLDMALAELKSCCANQKLSAAQLVKRLDSITNTSLFSKHYQRFDASYHIPAYLPLLAELGVRIEEHKMVITNRAPAATIRQAIYRGRGHKRP